jgi:DNA uptake protein ComE-like DNA-binding protein
MSYRNHNSYRTNRKDRGLVLVLVLWVLVVLAVLMVGLSQNTRLDNMVRIVAADRVTARWAARSGAYRAIGEVLSDTNLTDNMTDSWYDNARLFNQVDTNILNTETPAGATFTVMADRPGILDRAVYGVIDEASKLNLRTVTVEQLARLDNVTATQAAALLRWRDQNKDAGNGQAGTSIATIRQVLAMGDVTAALLYGEDVNLNGVLDYNENDGPGLPPDDNQDGILDRGLLAYVTIYSYEYNQDGNKQPRININKAGQDELENKLHLTIPHALWIVEHRPYTTIADLVDEAIAPEPEAAAASTAETSKTGAKAVVSIRPDRNTFVTIADHITVTDRKIIPGRININTASVMVLQTLAGMDKPLAQQIDRYRQNNSAGFDNIAKLLEVPGVTVPIFRQVAPYITVRSNVFTIRSWGWAPRSDLRHTVEAVIDRGNGNPSILYWSEKIAN